MLSIVHDLQEMLVRRGGQDTQRVVVNLVLFHLHFRPLAVTGARCSYLPWRQQFTYR